MSVYHIYTKTAHIPTYLVFKCQRCKSVVAAMGYYNLSTSYSDRGAWGKKGVAKREAASTEQLESMTKSELEYLRRDATPIHEDYGHIQCQCPKCGHPSLGIIGDKRKLSRLIALVAMIMIAVLYVINMLNEKGFDARSIIPAVVASVIGAGIVFFIAEKVLNAVEKVQMKRICEEAAPLMSSNRDILMNAAMKVPAFKNADFSAIMNSANTL